MEEGSGAPADESTSRDRASHIRELGEPAPPSGFAEGRSRERPRHVIVFKRAVAARDTRRELANAVGARVTMSTMDSRPGVVSMTSASAGELLLYEPLGVAVGSLSEEERASLQDGDVATVFENRVRTLPPPVRIVEVAAHSAGRMPSRMTTSSSSACGPELEAFLLGQRYAIESTLHFAGLLDRRPALPSAPSARRGARAAGSSWCVEMIGVGAETTHTGRDVRIAVLDTGIDLQHADLAHHFVDKPSHHCSFVDEPVIDLNGHGTHCCGVVAGRALPAQGPRYGVAPDATLLVGKVLNNRGRGNDDGIIDGLMWAALQGADVISLSLAGPEPEDVALYGEIGERLLGRNILLVAAVGNLSDRPGHVAPVCYPAAAEGFLGVGAIDREYEVASFSCGGQGLDLVAPGVDVYSAYRCGGYAEVSGTSMAAPHVAGAAAVWAERTGKRGAELRDVLLRNARPLSGSKQDIGAGLVAV